ncbi:porin [Alcaligenes endophyticus]|uniref:Porin n=1 Tax=Alcaligenes endophyticus TaxID=1929088 RepID=A0ABT8EHL0_9BURK|nr:porin [Alcaligenes endophyticus]MCX5592110.1 porin [Alcaligenes endophyticus]MDN4120757.1 porin [Alcaligenes endophyticus]
MKKTLLAAALMAGFAGIAHAETSVTLYGIVDGGIGFNQYKGSGVYGGSGNSITSKKTGLINGVQSGNRWGLKGSEDLGDGLRAVFQLESGFDLGTGGSAQGSAKVNNRLFGRQATLGLAGDSWGQLDFGRQTNIGSKYMPGIVDPFGGGFDQANVGAAFTSVNTVRYDNLVTYQTPNFSGFQFGVGYSFNTDGAQAYKESGGLEENQRAITTALRYSNGPIGLVATYDQRKTAEFYSGNNVVGGDTVKAWNIGGSYDFEVVKASLAFGQTRDGMFATQSFSGERLPANINGKGLKVNSYLVGLSAPVGAGNVMASWTMADPRSAPDAFQGTGAEFKKQHTYSLGYTHPLSKRTNVYAIGSYAKNVHFSTDAKSTLVGVGLRHQF